MSISSLFAKGEALFERLQEDSSDQEAVKQCFQTMLQVHLLIGREEVFSGDDELEDLSPVRLRYTVVPYYLGHLCLMVHGNTSTSTRSQMLLRSKSYFDRFLGHCQQLRVIPEEDLKSWTRTTSLSGAQKREEKLARGRRQLQYKKQMGAIRKQVADAEDAQIDWDSQGVDEEVFLSMVRLKVEDCCQDSVSQIQLIEDELPLAEMMEKRRQLERAKTDSWKQSHDEPAGGQRQTSSSEGAPRVELPPGYNMTPGANGSYTISKQPGYHPGSNASSAAPPPAAADAASIVQTYGVNRRAQLQRDALFTPGHIMSTVSIEQAGEIDYHEMMEREQRQNAAALMQEEKPGSEDDEYYDAVTVYEKRDWDSFKDDNPTGSGNRANKG